MRRRIADHQRIAARFQIMARKDIGIGGDAQHVVAAFRQNADALSGDAKCCRNATACGSS
jgi:hypothetical protein